MNTEQKEKKSSEEDKIWKCRECFKTFDAKELDKCPNCNSPKIGKVLPLNDDKFMERINWSPYGWQNEALEAYLNNRDIRIAAGARSGKSMFSSYTAAREFAKDDKHIWIVAPTYSLSEKVFNYAVDFIKEAFSPNQYSLKGGRPMEIKSEWGSFIKSKSMENKNNLLAEGLDLAVIDEASRMGKEVWEKYIYQRLSSRKGKSVMISTPYGKNTPFYNEWVRCKTAKDGWSAQIKSIEGPMIDEDDWKRAKEQLPEDAFRQELKGEFLDDAASVFSTDTIDSLVDETVLEGPRKGHKYVTGVDLGKRNDYTVITVMDKYSHNVVYWNRFNIIDWNLQKKRIISVCQQYNNSRLLVDSTGKGDPIIEDLRHNGFIVEDYSFSSKSKEQLIDKLSIFIDQEAIVLPDKEELLDELKSFGYRTTNKKTGEPLKRVKYSAPPGMHDDCVDSLALAVWQLRKPKRRDPRKVLQRKKQRHKKRYNNFE